MQRLSETGYGSWLGWFLRGILILGSLLMVGRLIELQLIKGSYFRVLAEGNRIKRIIIPAERGKIYARGGEILEGLDFAHIIGYLAEATPKEVGKIDPRCLEKGHIKLKQLVGRSGLEEYYNCTLSGIDGEELWEVDSLGKNLRFLGKKKQTSGTDIKTSIDFSLQKKIAQIFGEKSGAVVMSDYNGNILAIYSSPTFDPKNVEDYLEKEDSPIFNRAMGGLYHPGSVFKPLVAISALEEGKIDKDYKYTDTGVLTVETLYGKYNYSNWYFTQYGGVEGEIDLTRALIRSTDTFFYKIGELTGIESLLEWVKRFGLTKPTEIDIPGEILSLIPSPDWKKKVKNEKWFLGNTYHFAIGQGDLALTPIGLHRSILAIANGGNLCSLKVVGETTCQKLGIQKENLDLVKEGMKGVCLPGQVGVAGGTGYTFFDFTQKHDGIEVYCKTGTAETNDDNKTHAWFSVFSEGVLLTVMVEKSGEGSKIAGPIAREIFDFYFKK